jgi:hypothetical protein
MSSNSSLYVAFKYQTNLYSYFTNFYPLDHKKYVFIIKQEACQFHAATRETQKNLLK